MIEEEREAAVEHLSGLLERDAISLEVFRSTVDRLLASTTAADLALVLAAVPAALPATEPPLVIHCDGGVVKERPTRLPDTVEIRCDSGVMKVDLSRADIEHPITDVEIVLSSGVLAVTLPCDAHVELGDHIAHGGVFRNRVRAVPNDAWRPMIVLHVQNAGGVLKVRRARRRRAG